MEIAGVSMDRKYLKILIITSYFPPANSIASLRPYSWAKYWSRAGHDVTVLTVPQGSISLGSTISTKGFKVIEVPIPGMKLFLKLFGPRYNENTTSSGGMAHDKTSISKTIKKFLWQMLIGFRNRYGIFHTCRMPDLFDLWGKAALGAVKNQHWNLVISTAGPYSVHRPAYHLKKSGIADFWISDWRDLWTDNHIYPGLPGFRSIERFLEKRWSRNSDAITTVSEPLAAVLRTKYGNKVHVIYNGFDPEDYANLPAENIFPHDNVFRIVYTGTIYTGKQDPSPLFKAVHKLYLQRKVNPELLKIIFCGGNSDVRELARKHGVENFVEYAGFLPRQQALHMQRDANMLLFLEFESEKVKGILTGKLFEYLFAGPPIIGVGLDEDSSVGLLLKQTGRGKCFGINEIKISEELKNDFSGKNSKALLINKINYKNISKFSRKEQSEKMLNILKLRGR